MEIILKTKKHFFALHKKTFNYKYKWLKGHYDNTIDKIEATEKNTKKTETYDYIQFGILEGNTFTWYPGMNTIIYDNIKEHIFSNEIPTIKELFDKQTITFDSNKYRFVIPYFIAIVLSHINIIGITVNSEENHKSLETTKKILISGIKLGISKPFNNDDFFLQILMVGNHRNHPYLHN